MKLLHSTTIRFFTPKFYIFKNTEKWFTDQNSKSLEKKVGNR